MQINNYNSGENLKTITRVTSSGPVSNITGIVVGLIILLIGVGIGIFTFLSYKQDLKQKDYLKIEATISDKKTDEDGFDTYTITYDVEGKTYTHDDIFAIEDGEIGSSVKIYYNPNNPDEISWGDKSTGFVMPAMTIIFLLIGLLTIVSNIKAFSNLGGNNENSTTIAFGDSATKIDPNMNDFNSDSDFNGNTFKF